MRTDVRARPPIAATAIRRSGVLGFFAVVLVACAVWVQASAGPGGTDRPGSGPLAALGTDPSLASTRVVVVQPGDTVWAIARRLQPSGDIRPLVDRLSAQLSGATLQVGQRLVVP